MNNRSVPVNSVLPHVGYRSVPEAIEWLTAVFGFREHYRYGEAGGVSGAQMYAGSAVIMLKKLKGTASPAEPGFVTQYLTIFIEDVEAHYQRAKAAEAMIVEEPNETVYGEFQYAARDLEGHQWLFSRHARDLAPEDWGGRSA